MFVMMTTPHQCKICLELIGLSGSIRCTVCRSFVHHFCAVIADEMDAQARASTFICGPCALVSVTFACLTLDDTAESTVHNEYPQGHSEDCAINIRVQQLEDTLEHRYLELQFGLALRDAIISQLNDRLTSIE